MIVPNADYRANPDRAVYVQGVIDQAMVDRLTPVIVGLTTKSRDPITVYIDSPGGGVLYKDALTRLLRAPSQDGGARIRVITVVTNRAASAAADLLAWGQYAIAYPGTRILYHGVRIPMDNPITAEVGSNLAQELKLNNERFAMALARDAEARFMFRFIASRDRHDEFRKQDGNSTASDLDCFVGLTRPKLSTGAQDVLGRALARYKRASELLVPGLKALEKKAKSSTNLRHAQIEASEPPRVLRRLDYVSPATMAGLV